MTETKQPRKPSNKAHKNHLTIQEAKETGNHILTATNHFYFHFGFNQRS